MGLPAVVLPGATQMFGDGEQVLVDANRGWVGRAGENTATATDSADPDNTRISAELIPPSPGRKDRARGEDSQHLRDRLVYFAVGLLSAPRKYGSAAHDDGDRRAALAGSAKFRETNNCRDRCCYFGDRCVAGAKVRDRQFPTAGSKAANCIVAASGQNVADNIAATPRNRSVDFESANQCTFGIARADRHSTRSHGVALCVVFRTNRSRSCRRLPAQRWQSWRRSKAIGHIRFGWKFRRVLLLMIQRRPRRSLPPIRKTLERLLTLLTQLPNDKNQPWELQAISTSLRQQAVEDLKSYLAADIPPQGITWTLRPLEGFAGKFKVTIKSADARPITAEPVLGDLYPPSQNIVLGTQESPLVQLNVVYPKPNVAQEFWHPFSNLANYIPAGFARIQSPTGWARSISAGCGCT